MINRLLIVVLFASIFSVEATETTSSKTVYSSIDRTQKAQTIAEMWNLTEADMDKYDRIMKGPRGTFSPNVAPPLGLALEETNPVEQRRYIEIYAKLEYERTTKDLKVSRLYSQVFKELFTKPVIDNSILFKNKEEYIRAGDIFVMFVDASCAECSLKVANDLMRTASFPRNRTDIYVKNLKSESDLHQWASKNNVKVEAVQSNRITLNLMQENTAHILEGKNYALHVLRGDSLFMFNK